MHHSDKGGKFGAAELRKRVELFDLGAYHQLLERAWVGQPTNSATISNTTFEVETGEKLKVARKLGEAGPFSKAAKVLHSKGLAPGTNETLQQLQDPVQRPPLQQESFTDDVAKSRTDAAINLDRNKIFQNLRGA